MQVAAVVGHGDRRGIEILEQFEISFSGVGASYH
jgi:hypothetical protein